MDLLKERVAIVTGGTSGIGRATVLAFAQRKAKVAFTGRRRKEGMETINLAQAAGGEVLFIQADMTQEAEVRMMVEKTIKAFGRLDYAFNNAGIEQARQPLPEQTEETFDRIMDINVKGVWLSMKHEIPEMLKAGGGAIVNASSMAGVVGVPGIPLYSASKHAVIGLTKAVALEYAQSNIRVNAVCSGVIDTAMIERLAAGNAEAMGQVTTMQPTGRMGRPEEIANAVVWLCSDAASFVTGDSLMLDGGYTAR